MDRDDANRRTCADCGAWFRLGETEREFYLRRGLQEPRRCKDCRRARRIVREAGEAGQQA